MCVNFLKSDNWLHIWMGLIEQKMSIDILQSCNFRLNYRQDCWLSSGILWSKGWNKIKQHMSGCITWISVQINIIEHLYQCCDFIWNQMMKKKCIAVTIYLFSNGRIFCFYWVQNVNWACVFSNNISIKYYKPMLEHLAVFWSLSLSLLYRFELALMFKCSRI